MRVQCISSERGVPGLKSVVAVGGFVVAIAAVVYAATRKSKTVDVVDAEDWLMGMFNDNGYGDVDA